MLNHLDDYPIHQTPEPIAHPASSDPNVYDRLCDNIAELYGIDTSVLPVGGDELAGVG